MVFKDLLEFEKISSFINMIALSTCPTYPNPSARAGYDTRSIFKRSLTGLNSEFSFSLTSCLTKAEKPSLSYYLPIAGGRIIGFIPFPRVLVLCEMQSVSSRIWTRVAVSISCDNNHYTTGTSHCSIHLYHNSNYYRTHAWSFSWQVVVTDLKKCLCSHRILIKKAMTVYIWKR